MATVTGRISAGAQWCVSRVADYAGARGVAALALLAAALVLALHAVWSIATSPHWLGPGSDAAIAAGAVERPAAGYWVGGLSGTCWRMELAFDERQPSWRDWARAQLRVGHDDIEWIAYRDPKAGRFRYAAVRDGRLEGCVFIAPDHKLVSRSWLTGLFAEQQLSPNARMSLLTGQPRSATVLAATGALVLELGKADLDPVLRARPALLKGLTTIMADRQARNLAGPRAPDAPSAAPSSEDILARLKSFFGIR